MKIVVAPDKFKGCVTAPDAARAMGAGLRRARADIEIDECPVADGGEGTVAALVAATGGRLESARVTGPLPEMKVDAAFGILGDRATAVIEMAAASGLALLRPQDRNPLNTTTFGTGELLLAAERMGVRHIILGIGGSATTDAGIGCAQGAGLTIVLENGQPVSPTEPLCGGDLDSVILVKHARGSPIDHVRITVACDVTNPLYGPSGAACIFGPQKGATPQQVRELDDSLRRLAERLGKTTEAATPGSGAAGGLGFGMLAFFNATLRPGAQIVLDAVRLRERLRGADLCITGEGRLDVQSLSGKAPIAVARLCKELNVPCLALVGAIGEGADAARTQGLTAYALIHDGTLTPAESMIRAEALLERSAERWLAERPPRP